MDGENETGQGKLDSMTRRWWFLLLFILFQFFPAYAQKGYDPSKWGEFIGHTLEHAFASSMEWLYPVFKIVPIILVISIIFLRNRATRWFDGYVGISYVLFAFLGSIAVTEQHGLAIITGNFVAFLVIAAFAEVRGLANMIHGVIYLRNAAVADICRVTVSFHFLHPLFELRRANFCSS